MGASTRTPAQFKDTVKTAFAAAWVAAGQNLDVVAWDNLFFDPSDLDVYVIASLAQVGGDFASLGGGTQVFMRRDAIFAAQIRVRHNTGEAVSDQLTEIVLDFLESAHIPGIRFRNVGANSAGRLQPWYDVNVSATVEYDSIRSV